jgi:hypothetical protein
MGKGSRRIADQAGTSPGDHFKDVVPAKVVDTQRHDHRPISGRDLSTVISSKRV